MLSGAPLVHSRKEEGTKTGDRVLELKNIYLENLLHFKLKYSNCYSSYPSFNLPINFGKVFPPFGFFSSFLVLEEEEEEGGGGWGQDL